MSNWNVQWRCARHNGSTFRSCCRQNPPEDGYLQFRNDTVSVFSCALGHVFLPELERTKAVRCGEDRRWSQRVGSCYPFDYLRSETGIAMTTITITTIIVKGDSD